MNQSNVAGHLRTVDLIASSFFSTLDEDRIDRVVRGGLTEAQSERLEERVAEEAQEEGYPYSWADGLIPLVEQEVVRLAVAYQRDR